MSVDLVKNEIRRLLSTRDPEVVCISGRWGVGKTYAWRDYLKKAQEGSNIALKRYSYVSLFGINSLDDLKYSVFANSIDMVSVGTEPSFETIKEYCHGESRRQMASPVLSATAMDKESGRRRIFTMVPLGQGHDCLH